LNLLYNTTIIANGLAVSPAGNQNLVKIMVKRRKRLNLKKINTIEGRKHDKIRVTDFKVSPVKSKKGQLVTVSMSITNVTSKTLKSVPWQIGVDRQILHNGIRYNLPGGDSFKVSITWTATAGEHFFFGDADPKNILKEPKIKQFNNLPQGIDVRVK